MRVPWVPADATRPRHPKDKPIVENGVRYARERFWKAETFIDLEDVWRRSQRWCRDVAGRRIHGTTDPSRRKFRFTILGATAQPARAISAEIIREKLIVATKEELPYSTAVVIDRFVEEPKIYRIFTTSFVERESQKRIIIGKAGQLLKQIGTEARQELERFFEQKIYLELHVKVKKSWRDDDETLRTMGLA
jgi:hypothetical protein